MKKVYCYKVEIPNKNDVLVYDHHYFIEKRGINNSIRYFISYESADKSVYYTIYGPYKKLGTAANKLQDITKHIPYRKNYHCTVDQINSVYGF